VTFSIGQQVVCVNDVFSPNPYWRSTVRAFPKLNGIYTIREIREAGDLRGFCFYEILNPRAWFAVGYTEPAFNVKNFRPVRKTSIKIFRRMLAPADLVGAE